MIETTLGFRSLIYRKKQYISLFLICFFGTAISLFSLFMSRGMLDSLNEKALVYYGGDLVVMSMEAYSYREEMLDLREKLLEVEAQRLSRSRTFTIDEVNEQLEDIINGSN